MPVMSPSEGPILRTREAYHCWHSSTWLAASTLKCNICDELAPVPAALHGLAREPARFEVVGAYYEPGTSVINRLAPIPGILGYDRGRAVGRVSRGSDYVDGCKRLSFRVGDEIPHFSLWIPGSHLS